MAWASISACQSSMGGPELVVSHPSGSPPLAVIAAADLAGLSIDLVPDAKLAKDSSPVLLIKSAREDLIGTAAIVRYIARSGKQEAKLYGADALSATQVDQWLDYSPAIATGGGLQSAVEFADQYLSLRMWFAGYDMSIADLAVWGQLQGAALQWDKMRKGGAHSHLSRWYDFMNQLAPLAAVLDKHRPKRLTAPEYFKARAEAGKGGGDTGSFDIKLKDAEMGKVVTRFPPEPSGYLHVGHAKAALLNQQFATMYKGQLRVRFDDTNPSKEKDEYVENILSDIAALSLKYDKLTYTSDYFDLMLELAPKLIKAGKIYADDTPLLQMREERMVGIESQRRDRSVEESLQVWEEMQKGSAEGLKNCMRWKISMTNPNKAMRDPVAYRCNLTPHHRTGTKYKVYPTYDLACPFVDALEGVTHALRTSEYKDREDQYYWILKSEQEVWPGLPQVWLWDFSRLSFVHTVLSKRKLAWFVEKGHVGGWDDPRFPTVQGIFRRGLQLQALKDFILGQGASKATTLQDWEKLWAFNKKVIDPVCPRHTAVKAEGRVLLQLSDGPKQPEVVILPRHKKCEAAGKKATTMTKIKYKPPVQLSCQVQDVWLEQEDAQLLHDGEEVTLMDWGNAIIEKVQRGTDGHTVTGLQGRLNLEGNVKATKWKLTWLPDIVDLVPLQLWDFGPLITKKKPEEDDDIADLVNPQSRWGYEALGDANTRLLQKGSVLQLERKGYFIVDQVLVRSGMPMQLFAIPDGRPRPVLPPPPPAANATVP